MFHVQFLKNRDRKNFKIKGVNYCNINFFVNFSI